MDHGSRRQCRHCHAGVPDRELTCPTCGRYFDGGFDVPDLIDGIRAVQPALEDLVAAASPDPGAAAGPAFPAAEFPEPLGGGWWAAEQPAPLRGPVADEHLPQVGGVTDLPYAEADPDPALDPALDPVGGHDRHPVPDVVIDLRDLPPPPGPARPAGAWLRRRSRT